MGSISRMTLFKLSNPADQDTAVAAYAKLLNDHSRVSHIPFLAPSPFHLCLGPS
jgi:hypothetical protein